MKTKQQRKLNAIREGWVLDRLLDAIKRYAETDPQDAAAYRITRASLLGCWRQYDQRPMLP